MRTERICVGSRWGTWAPSGIFLPPDSSVLDTNSKCCLIKVRCDCQGPGPSGMKISVTAPGEAARPAQITAECEEEFRMNNGFGRG